MDFYNDLPSIEIFVKKHLSKYQSIEKIPDSWFIANTKKCGRSVFATRDVKMNELICSDPPLLIGFTGNGCKTIICVCCYREITVTDICLNGCGLSVCKDCTQIDNHRNECELLRSWNPRKMATVSGMKLKSLSSFRSLLLNENDRKLLSALQSNRNKKNEEHIDVTISEFESFDQSDLQKIENLKRIASIMNTNAFQNRLSSASDEINISIRVLYPFLAFLNHNCVPNTRRSIDRNNVAHLYAVRDIRKGEEINTSYSQILWSTPSRQAYFKVTKDFQCDCDRCQDPTERGTYLSALKCLSKPCAGLILPLEPTMVSTIWKCTICCDQFPSGKVYQAQSVLSSLTSSKIANSDIKCLIEFIDQRLSQILPDYSQMVVEMKLAALRFIDRVQESEIANADYQSMEQYCIELLKLLHTLNAGESVLKGVLSYNLYKCRKALAQKTMPDDICNQKTLYEVAKRILENTLAEPAGLKDVAAARS